MKRLFLLLMGFSAAPALAYEPEALIRKLMVETERLSQPGKQQYLNPFSKVGAGWERSTKSSQLNEYSVILKTKGIVEAKKYQKLAEALSQEIELSEKLLRSQGLQLGYNGLIQTALAKDLGSSLEALKELAGKNHKLNAIAALRSQSEIKNVLKANNELRKTVEEILELESQFNGIRAVLGEVGLTIDNLETTDLVGIEEIATAIESGGNKTPGSLSAKKAQSEANSTKLTADYSIAARSRLLDGIKISLAQEKNKENIYKFELSFNLSALAAQDLSDYQDRIKAAEAEVKGKQAERELRIQAAAILDTLKGKITLYRNLGVGPKDENSAILRQDPLLAMELKRSIVSHQITKSTLLAEIRALYIQYLLENETLASHSDINHLSRSKRKI